MELKTAVEEQYKLLVQYSILITCFSYKTSNDVDAYRFYFKDLKRGYIHNPMTENELGKKSFPFFIDYNLGLIDQITEAYKYIEKNNILPV